jgi:hypothetical protein
MAVESRALTTKQFQSITSPVVGLRVSKPWLGYANAFFLELGALHAEAMPKLPSSRKLKLKTKTLRGQAGVMIDSEWRVERHGRFSFGRGSKNSQIKSGLKEIRDRRVKSVAVSPCGPELFLQLEGGFHIHSFSNFGPPCWAVFLGDPELFPRDPRWSSFDHSLLVTFDEETGKLAKQMCYGPKPDISGSGSRGK